MCDVLDLIFCKMLTIWVKGRPKTPSEWFLAFLMIFQNRSQVEVICTRYLARPPRCLLAPSIPLPLCCVCWPSEIFVQYSPSGKRELRPVFVQYLCKYSTPAAYIGCTVACTSLLCTALQNKPKVIKVSSGRLQINLTVQTPEPAFSTTFLQLMRRLTTVSWLITIR